MNNESATEPPIGGLEIMKDHRSIPSVKTLKSMDKPLMRKKIVKTTAQINFDIFSGEQFERLAFAYILRLEKWKSICWYGQLGKDGGRDILGELSGGICHCFQCANHQKIQSAKATSDIDKICNGPKGIPNKFVLIIGGKISGKMRDKITGYAKSKGIPESEVVSGPEFEEKLRMTAPEVLRRFCEGEEFPETVTDLLKAFPIAFNDREIIDRIARYFDRPAFTTPFHQESNLPDFKKAITDTIEAINTGIHKTRSGIEIDRNPSKNTIHDDKIRSELDEIVKLLISLRLLYDNGIRSGEISHCGCNDPNCPVHMISYNMCQSMDSARDQILSKIKLLQISL